MRRSGITHSDNLRHRHENLIIGTRIKMVPIETLPKYIDPVGHSKSYLFVIYIAWIVCPTGWFLGNRISKGCSILFGIFLRVHLQYICQVINIHVIADPKINI